MQPLAFLSHRLPITHIGFIVFTFVIIKQRPMLPREQVESYSLIIETSRPF